MHALLYLLAFSMSGAPKVSTAERTAAASSTPQKSPTGTPALRKCCFCRSLSCSTEAPNEHTAGHCNPELHCTSDVAEGLLLLELVLQHRSLKGARNRSIRSQSL